MLHRPLPRIQYITNIINIICSCENFSCLGTYIIYYSLYSPHQLDVGIFQGDMGILQVRCGNSPNKFQACK